MWKSEKEGMHKHMNVRQRVTREDKSLQEKGCLETNF